MLTAVCQIVHPTILYKYSSQFNGTHYDNNAQHGARYKSTKLTTLPLPGNSQHTHLSTINVHNARTIDSAHFAQPMSHNRTCRSAALVRLCNNSPVSSTCMVSYINRQYARTVPNVDIIGSSICHTRHLATRRSGNTRLVVTEGQIRAGRRQKPCPFNVWLVLNWICRHHHHFADNC
jgi:hypothetical protein